MGDCTTELLAPTLLARMIVCIGVDHRSRNESEFPKSHCPVARLKSKLAEGPGSHAVRPILHCPIRVDRRTFDGDRAASFGATFAELIETPGLVLLPFPEAFV
jgi:hypothetical protein